MTKIPTFTEYFTIHSRLISLTFPFSKSVSDKLHPREVSILNYIVFTFYIAKMHVNHLRSSMSYRNAGRSRVCSVWHFSLNSRSQPRVNIKHVVLFLYWRLGIPLQLKKNQKLGVFLDCRYSNRYHPYSDVLQRVIASCKL